MKKFIIALMAIVLVAGMAMAEKPLVQKGDPITRGALDCSNALPINCGDLVSGDTTGQPANVPVYNIGYNHEDGPEMVYELVLPGDPGTSCYVVSGTISNFSPADLDIYFLSACDEMTAIKYGDSSFTTDCIPAGTYYVVVDGYNADDFGPFDLEVTCVECDCPVEPTELQGADNCSDGVCLEPGLFAVSGTTAGYAADYDPDCISWGLAAADVVYELALADGNSISADLVSSGWDSGLYLMTDCLDMSSTLACDDAYPTNEHVEYTNNTGADMLIFLVVDGYGSGEGDYVLTYTHDGLTCESPVSTEATTFDSLKSMYR